METRTAPDPRRWWALGLLAAAQFMVIMDTSIIGVALPEMQRALGFSQSGLSWVFNAYVVAFGGLLLLGGRLSDLLGARRVFIAGWAVLTGASVLAGLAGTAELEIAGRALQGAGAALIAPAALALLMGLFGHEPRELTRAFAVYGAAAPAGGTAGVFLGGVLTEWVDWRWVFLVNVPVGIVGWWLNRRAMPEIRDPRRPFDGIGFVLFALASGLLLTAAEFASEDQLAVGGTAALAGVTAAALYWAHSQRTAHPINDLGLLKIRSFWIAVGGSLFTRLGVSGMPFVFALFLQVGCGWSPLAAGLMMMPQALAMMAMKVLIDPLLKRYGYRRTLYVNTVLVAILLALFALLTAHTPWPWMALLNFAYGLVMSLQYTAMNTLAFVDLQPAQAGHASSMTSTAQYLSMSFGIALASMLMSAYVGPHRQLAAAYVSGFRFSAVVLALLTLVGAFIFTRLRRDRALRASVDTPETAS